jgi:hypothetical protein
MRLERPLSFGHESALGHGAFERGLFTALVLEMGVPGLVVFVYFWAVRAWKTDAKP